ncbi:bucky ball isoform X2 [Lepisosteus oculatus]
MEEMNNPQHPSSGSGQPHQHPVNHTRPFFYVQPPSQPYFLYQWHMNNPFGQYGFHGSGFPFGRPYLPPYPYMQYPGYVVPQAPMQPMDYRRMFNPHFPSTGAYDVRFRYHQTRMRRETATSEVQTDPSEAVNKLIESLGKMGACHPASEKELDSGIASQNSGTFVPGDEQKQVAQNEGKEPQPQRSVPKKVRSGDKPLSSPVKVFSEPAAAAAAAAAAYDVESNQRRLEDLARQEGWSVSSCEGVLPLDSSSVHEENVGPKAQCSDESEPQVNVAFPEKFTDGSGSRNRENQGTRCGRNKSDKLTGLDPQPGAVQGCDVASKQGGDTTWPLAEPLPSNLPPSNWLAHEGAEQAHEVVTKMASPADKKKSVERQVPGSEDLQYNNSKQSCGAPAPSEELQKDNPLWYIDSAASFIPPSSYLSTFGNSYYYSYYPQIAQERQSVLSPSLDELSSRDEMFSTDLEDIDLMPGHVYAGGRLGHVANEVQERLGEEIQNSLLHEEECPVCPKMKTCATCGSSLSKETKKSKVSASGNTEYTETEDTYEELVEEEKGEVSKKGRELRKAASMKKPPHPKRPSQPCSAARPLPKQKSRKGCCGDNEDSTCHEHQGKEYPEESECCEEHKTASKAEKHKGQETKNVHLKRQTEKPWREGTVTSDQESWESYGAKPRSKQWKPYPSRGRDQERPPRKRASYKAFVYQKPRRNDCDDNEDGDLPRVQRGRGSTKRRGTRY